MTIASYLNWAAIGLGFTAAILWFVSTKTRVRPDPDSNEFQIIETEERKEYDVLETAKRQVQWNGRAALATGAAVLCQAASMLLRQVL